MSHNFKIILFAFSSIVLNMFLFIHMSGQTSISNTQKEIQNVWNRLKSNNSVDYYSSATIGDVRITKNGFLYKLDRPSEHGFELSDINYFQNLAFSSLNKCNCLTPTYDHPTNTYYTQLNEIVNGYGDHVRYEKETKSRTEFTSGLLNSTKSDLYIRAFSKRRVSSYGVKNNPIEYFDDSFILKSNESMEKEDFNLIPKDNGKKIDAEQLEKLGYSLDAQQRYLQGYSEYTRFVGVYTNNKELVNECNQRQLTISVLAKSLGTNLYKVDGYTGRTNIKVKAGDKIIIKANGRVKWRRDREESGPEGTTAISIFSNDERLLPEFKLASLLASVGECDWSEIGNYDEWTTQCNGELNIMINDNNPANNSGSFTVEIKIVRSR